MKKTILLLVIAINALTVHAQNKFLGFVNPQAFKKPIALGDAIDFEEKDSRFFWLIKEPYKYVEVWDNHPNKVFISRYEERLPSVPIIQEMRRDIGYMYWLHYEPHFQDDSDYQKIQRLCILLLRISTATYGNLHPTKPNHIASEPPPHPADLISMSCSVTPLRIGNNAQVDTYYDYRLHFEGGGMVNWCVLFKDNEPSFTYAYVAFQQLLLTADKGERIYKQLGLMEKQLQHLQIAKNFPVRN